MDATVDLIESDTWPVEKVEALRELWAKGVKKADIAAQLRVSPHAITGKVYRMGFQRDDVKEKKVTFRAAAKKIIQAKPAPKPKSEPVQTKAPSVPKFSPEVDSPNARPWLERGYGECCYPIGVPERPALQMACCNKTPPGKSYCTAHQTGMFQQDRRR